MSDLYAQRRPDANTEAELTLEKIKLTIPVIVEGKYDKAALSSIADACIITTDGFGIFKNNEKSALIKRLSEKGVIVLCDSDGAGGVIRSRIASMIPKERLYQLYVPRIPGRERRKRRASREGILGVEGVPSEILRDTLLRLVSAHPELCASDASSAHEDITKLDFYNFGLTGSDRSGEKRDTLALHFALPAKMTPNALLSALNMIMSRDDFYAVCDKLFNKDGTDTSVEGGSKNA